MVKGISYIAFLLKHRIGAISIKSIQFYKVFIIGDKVIMSRLFCVFCKVFSIKSLIDGLTWQRLQIIYHRLSILCGSRFSEINTLRRHNINHNKNCRERGTILRFP